MGTAQLKRWRARRGQGRQRKHGNACVSIRVVRACRYAGLATAFTAVAILATGCASVPSNPDNLCAIFKERSGWHRAATAAERRWGIPSPVMMAVMFKESSYVHDAKPPRTKLLWVIPWRRESSAYGFAQATDAAWKDYLRATGNRGSDRDDFGDAVDFVGWYLNRAHRQAGIRTGDARNLYLAYYAGVGGYQRGTWKNNAWLKRAAGSVAARSDRYARQLAGCKLKRRWRLFG